jgi:NAD(P)-dependent dehydrogenase (short-subunit alcohol dehydrogenase family)
MNGLRGKVGVVVGGASGVGKATSLRLAQEGVSVVVADINDAGAKAVAESIRSEGGTAEPFGVDLSDESQVGELVTFAVQRFGGVDLLHNVAADLVHCTTNDHDILTTTLDAFDQTWAVTLRGYVLSCRAVLPSMLERGGGAIVNTSSLAALRALPAGRRFSYSIAKSGLGPLSQHIAVRYGKEGVRCNTVALGMVLSEGFLKTNTPERVAELKQAALVPDPGEPAGIAAAVAFLLSDDARYITGQTINVDGGSSAQI